MKEVEARPKPKKGSSVAPASPDITSFLRPVGVMELRYVRMMSNLCALTYLMDKVTVRACLLTPTSALFFSSCTVVFNSIPAWLSLLQTSGLLRRHKLSLVTTSLACDFMRPRTQVTPYQVAVEGDAMAADISSVLAAQQSIEQSAAAADGLPAMQVLAKLEPVTTSKGAAATAPAQAPADIVASSLASAAAAAAAAASSAAGSVASAAAPIAAPIANNISAFTSSVASVAAATPIQVVASQLQTAASAGQSSAVAAAATVSAAMGSTATRDRRSARVPDCATSPTHWFVVDDEAARTRLFIIQGSDNMDHWRVNLTFDPVLFESPELGVKVHRGVYEAAQQLYDRFLPLVQEHLATSPSARITFTGHSLGGSLATLLMMMYVHRGVVEPCNLAPVYTFGAPAIFCEGSAGACGIDGGAPPPTRVNGILDRLGLPASAVRNVVMHKDIVPRAFGCDYSLVADILKRVHESFKENVCLSGSRVTMFHFVGKVMVLQPAAEAAFVAKEGYHAMLPQRPGLYMFRDPGMLQAVAAQVRRDAELVASAVHCTTDAISNLPARATSTLAVPTKAGAAPESPAVGSAQEAVWHLMNNPHPLDILADPGAYGDAGSISRYHNPDNYTRALGGVLKSRGANWKTLVRNAKRAGVDHFRPVLMPEQAAKDRAEPSGGGKMHIPPVHPHGRAHPRLA